jgi:hypothetical protein
MPIVQPRRPRDYTFPVVLIASMVLWIASVIGVGWLLFSPGP